MEQIVITVILKPKAGFREQLLIELKKVQKASRAEEGCIKYDLHESIEEEAFVLYEVWKDSAAFESHNETTHFLEYRAAIADIITTRERHILKVVE